VLTAALCLDGTGQVTGDAGDHLGQLDRDRHVMDEVDQDAQVGHHQPERHLTGGRLQLDS
jgi:hypothetical protein